MVARWGRTRRVAGGAAHKIAWAVGPVAVATRRAGWTGPEQNVRGVVHLRRATFQDWLQTLEPPRLRDAASD